MKSIHAAIKKIQSLNAINIHDGQFAIFIDDDKAVSAHFSNQYSEVNDFCNMVAFEKSFMFPADRVTK
jgi:hypothetical protein